MKLKRLLVIGLLLWAAGMTVRSFTQESQLRRLDRATATRIAQQEMLNRAALQIATDALHEAKKLPLTPPLNKSKHLPSRKAALQMRGRTSSRCSITASLPAAPKCTSMARRRR
jgi:hypothetical protein